MNKQFLSDYKILYSLSYHNNSVFHIILLENKDLASCSRDKSIIIYSKNDYKKIKLQIFFEELIFYIEKYKQSKLLLTVGKKIILIQLKNNNTLYDKIFEIVAHKKLIYKTIYLKNYKNNFIASCSDDKLIKIWEEYPINNFINISIFKTHNKRVTSIYGISNGILISTSYYESTIKFYDLEKTIFLKSLNVECVGLYNTLIELNKNYICLCGNKKGIFLINIVNYEIDKILNIDSFCSVLKKINDNTILLGISHSGMDGEYFNIEEYKIKENNIWEFSSSLQNIHKHLINEIILDDEDNIITCSSDRTIKILKKFK